MAKAAAIKIEKGVPLPAHGNTKHPFADMEVGDSFLASAESSQKVRSAAFNYGKYNNKKFTVRKTADGTRVWRTA